MKVADSRIAQRKCEVVSCSHQFHVYGMLCTPHVGEFLQFT